MSKLSIHMNQQASHYSESNTHETMRELVQFLARCAAEQDLKSTNVNPGKETLND